MGKSTGDQQEIWRCALELERAHGDGAEQHVADKITEAQAAVEFWQAVAIRLTELHHIAEPLPFQSVIAKTSEAAPPSENPRRHLSK